jgi:hypothetical protein
MDDSAVAPLHDAALATELRELLRQPRSARAFLFELVRWLDLRTHAAAIRLADEPDALTKRALARALVAAGALREPSLTTDRTLQAAREYADDPTEAHWAVLQQRATASYPFGPGDGCYRVPDLGVPDCGPGSGCSSGAGTLVNVAEEVGYEAAADAVRRYLEEWLS